MYPVDAMSGRSKEQAASTDVIPAAVPSTVFSAKRESYINIMQQTTLIKSLITKILTASFTPPQNTILVPNH
jgi:hypothetical protein